MAGRMPRNIAVEMYPIRTKCETGNLYSTTPDFRNFLCGGLIGKAKRQSESNEALVGSVHQVLPEWYPLM